MIRNPCYVTGTVLGAHHAWSHLTVTTIQLQGFLVPLSFSELQFPQLLRCPSKGHIGQVLETVSTIGLFASLTAMVLQWESGWGMDFGIKSY